MLISNVMLQVAPVPAYPTTSIYSIVLVAGKVGAAIE